MAPSSNTFDSSCIFVNAYPDGLASNANVHDNDISFCDVGILITSKLVNEDNSFATVLNNSFHNLNLAISFEKDSGKAKIEGNTFEQVVKETNRTPVAEVPVYTYPTPVVIEPVESVQNEQEVVEVSNTEASETVETPNLEIIPAEETSVVPEVPVEDVEVVDSVELAASVGNALTLGTNNTFVGFIVVFALLILVSYLSRKYF